MNDFRGIEVKAYSNLSDMPRVTIDRVRVEAVRTLFGETEYHVMGTLGRCGEGWPLCRPFADFSAAWDAKTALEQQIQNARREQEYGKGDLPAPEGAV